MSAKRIEFKGAEQNALIADQYGTGGQPVILLHGGGQTRHSWAAAAERIAALGHVVYSVDQRGHGESAWVPSGNYMFVHFAQDLVALCQQVIAKHGAKPVVVGASLGGFAGMLAEGAEAPGNQAALVLVDITPRIDSEGVARIQGFMRAKLREGFGSIAEAADAVAAYLPHRPKPRSHEGLKKNLRLHPDGRWRWHWDPRFLEGNRRIGPGSGEVEQALVAAARRVTIPTLLVRGASSELVGEEHAKDFLTLVPHARYVDVTGARHMVAGDRNDQFADAIESFLGELKMPA